LPKGQASPTAETARVGDLVKAKEIAREDVAAAIAGLFEGRTALPLGQGGYELILPDLAKMAAFSREAIISALTEGKARKG